MDHHAESPPRPSISAARNDGLVDPAGREGHVPRVGSPPARPVHRRGRRRFALHFGLATGEARYTGRGLITIPPELTLFACLITPDAAAEQRPLATCSRGGLAPAVRGGTLQLFQADAGWADSRIPSPTGSWVACAIGRRETERVADFFLFDCETRMIRRGSAATGRRPGSGDGVLTLNRRSGGASFIGAMTAAGLPHEVWSEAHFRRHLARLFGFPGPPKRRAMAAARGRPGAGGAKESPGFGDVIARCPVGIPRRRATPDRRRSEASPILL